MIRKQKKKKNKKEEDARKQAKHKLDLLLYSCCHSLRPLLVVVLRQAEAEHQ